jgi:hypothetical protein
MKISFSGDLLRTIEREAKALNLTPGLYIRMRMSELFRDIQTDAAEKSYVIRLENWREVEAYAKVKHGSSVADYAAKVAVSEMRRCPLGTAQKADFDRLLGKQG